MAQTKLKQVYQTSDGTTFETAKEAHDYNRRPLIEAALRRVAGGDAGLTKFLFENSDEIQNAFEAGVVKRVTKAERKRISASMAYLKTINDGKLKFLQDNANAIVDSFRWPGVKRMNDEEKVAATKEALTALADEAAANWIIKNRDAIFNAYQAGVEKRVPPPNSGLEEYKKAKAAGPEALAAYNAKKAATKAKAA